MSNEADHSSPSPQAETPPTGSPSPPKKSDRKLIAGLLGLSGLVWGGWGVHKFYLGYTKAGIIQILLNLACGLGALIGIIEGIIYLTKTDEEFEETYIKNEKHWF